MARRRVVVIASAAVLFALGVAALAAVYTTTQTDWGRERIRRLLVAELPHVIHGRVYIGTLGGGLFSDLTIDSLEIRDPEGEIFIATGRVALRYDLRDLMDQRIVLQQLEVAHPVVQIIHYPTGPWNLDLIFPPAKPSRTTIHTRGFGDYVVITDATVRQASVTVIEPWHPDVTFKTARQRDSAGLAAVATDSNVRLWRQTVVREHRWRAADIQTPYVRLANPDSVGMAFVLGDVSADESDPLFHFRHAHGRATIVRDTLQINLTHFELPGSRGHGGGRVSWGDGPIRLALHVVADTASFSDVAWVYPHLPTDGGGSAAVDIHNERDPRIVDFALSRLHVATTASRFTGSITFGIGGPYLIIKDLHLRVDPLDFRFVSQLTGQPLPYDFHGGFRGAIDAAGGPVNRFVVDSARLVYRDANVPGATSALTAAGIIDLHVPDSTRFHGLRIGLGRLDLRTLEVVNDALPKLGGIVTGTLTLDSLYTDLRFRDASLTHTDGDAPATHVSGGGRITFGDSTPVYDLAVRFDPLSFEALRPSYPGVWFQGEVAGPLRMRGRLDALDLDAELEGDDGDVGVHGRFDLQGPVFAGRGFVTLNHADLPELLGRPGLPPTDLTGRADGDVHGDSLLGDLAGPLTVSLAGSEVDSVHVDTLRAVMRFADGSARVDTLHLSTAVGDGDATGALALVAGLRDSLGFDATLDSLGGLRPYVGSADSLVGTARITGWVAGWLDSLSLSGRVDADNLHWGRNRIRAVQGAFAVAGLPTRGTGTIGVTFDTLSLAGIALDEVGAEARLTGGGAALVTATVVSGNGPTGQMRGRVRRHGDTTDVWFDSLSLRTESNDWHLDQPGRLRLDSGGVELDSLMLRGAVSGTLTARALLPVDGRIALHFTGDSVPLSDLSTLLQRRETFQGSARFDIGVDGTRASPRIALEGRLTAGAFGDVRLDEVLAHLRYADRRLDLHSDFVVRGDTALHAHASVPIDLAFTPHGERLLVDDSLAGELRSDSAKLGTVLAIFPTLRNPSGWFSAHVDLKGSWRHPAFGGEARVGDGAVTIGGVGVRWTDVNTALVFSGDSVAIEHATLATAVGERRGTATIGGWLTFADIDDPKFRVTVAARQFHAVDRPRLADVTLTTVGAGGEPAPLVFSGSEHASVLSGKVRIDAASIFLPELTQKQVVSLSDPELYNVIDTTRYANQRLLPNAPTSLLRGIDLRGVSIALGDNTWLKSSEANINLSGAVDVTTKVNKAASDTNPLLALSGTVMATRGTYVLNLGIVQRTFTVEQPGTISFNGEPQFNPDLLITAVNTVRQSGALVQQYGRPEVRIQVRLSGTLNDPKLALFSDDSLPQSDLISYLVSGVPAYQLSQSRADQIVSSVVLPSLGSALGSRLTGGVFDAFQVQTGGTVDPALATNQTNSYQNALLATRIGAGKQIGPRTYLSADYGFCGSTNGSTDLNPADQLRVRIEQRLTNNLALDASSQPATVYTYCTGDTPAAGFITTPRQYGLDLFRTWRF